MLSERAAMMINPSSGESIHYRAQVGKYYYLKNLNNSQTVNIILCFKLLCNKIVTIF